MSTFSVPVVQIGNVERLSNSDTLSITEVEGCPVIFKTGEFKTGDLAVYIPVESVVPLDNPATSFLREVMKAKEDQKTVRIKAKKLRGTFSMGVLIPFHPHHQESPTGEPLPVSTWIGVDMAADLGIVKYEEPEHNMPHGAGSSRRTPDTRFAPIYDIESVRPFWHLFQPGELVIVTEKIHGMNTRMSFRRAGDEIEPSLHVGSRKYFYQESDQNVWWMAAKKYNLNEKLKALNGLVLFGEVYGQVQDLKYGTTPEDPLRFAAFDLYDPSTKRFLDFDEFWKTCIDLEIPRAPVLYHGPFDRALIEPLAVGNTIVSDHYVLKDNQVQPVDPPKQMREGWVMRPAKERWDRKLGRVIVKLVGEDYLLRKGGTEYQ